MRIRVPMHNLTVGHEASADTLAYDSILLCWHYRYHSLTRPRNTDAVR